jgi:hypothetical protein
MVFHAHQTLSYACISTVGCGLLRLASAAPRTPDLMGVGRRVLRLHGTGPSLAQSSSGAM